MDIIPSYSISGPIVDIIKNKGYEFDPQGFICSDDLNNFRNLYIQGILADENGQLSALEEEILKSMTANNIISKDTNEDIDQNITFGQSVSDRIAKFGGSCPFI